MAKQKRVLPTRKPGDRSRDDESLLLRSAESLGRVIGALQRQLDGATRRLSDTASGAFDVLPPLNGRKTTRRGKKRSSATTKSAGAKNMNGGAAGKTKKTKTTKISAPRKKKTTRRQ